LFLCVLFHFLNILNFHDVQIFHMCWCMYIFYQHLFKFFFPLQSFWCPQFLHYISTYGVQIFVLFEFFVFDFCVGWHIHFEQFGQTTCTSDWWGGCGKLGDGCLWWTWWESNKTPIYWCSVNIDSWKETRFQCRFKVPFHWGWGNGNSIVSYDIGASYEACIHQWYPQVERRFLFGLPF